MQNVAARYLYLKIQNSLMKKRGQIDSHIFMYILTVFVVGLILVVGYNYITKGTSTFKKSEVALLKNRIVSDIDSVGKEFGKFKKVTYALPENINEVCFADLARKDEILSSKLIDLYPIIKDAFKSDSGVNAFFFGTSDQLSYAVKDFEINHYPYLRCFKRQEDKITMGLSGLGGGKTLLIGEFLTKAKVNSQKSVVLQSADGVITLEIPPGTTANYDEVSIEMIEPLAVTGASDFYRREPAGTIFSQPVTLRIKFNQALVGGCPKTLSFKQVSQTTKETYNVQSKQIDCDNSIATFEIIKF